MNTVVKTFEQFIVEGFYDPGILKAFFMAGGPGSGKSYVANTIFDLPKNATSTVSYSTGLKMINNDIAFEKMAKEAGFDLSNLSQIEDTPEWERLMKIRDRAKQITAKFKDNFIAGRLGLIIDGTGKDVLKIKEQKIELENNFGYDTHMIFVNTSLEVALERNFNRDRKLPESLVKTMWNDVQNNIGQFQQLFGREHFFIIDNSTYTDNTTIKQIEKIIKLNIKNPVTNPIGKQWLKTNDPKLKS